MLSNTHNIDLLNLVTITYFNINILHFLEGGTDWVRMTDRFRCELLGDNSAR